MAAFLIAVLVWAGAATIAAAALVARSPRPPVERAVQSPDEATALLAATRGDSRRYEIMLVDLGELHRPASMRWQATVYDADRVLRTKAYFDPTLDPDGVLGVEAPYWLANGPDEAGALHAATGWVLSEGGAPVLATQPLGGEV